jgi:hypothetical protein
MVLVGSHARNHPFRSACSSTASTQLHQCTEDHAAEAHEAPGAQGWMLPMHHRTHSHSREIGFVGSWERVRGVFNLTSGSGAL